MADTTTRYGWPYQEAGDPPDGAGLGQDLAEAIETSLGTVEDAADTRLDAVEARVTTIEDRLTITTGTANVGPTNVATELIVDQVTINAVSGRRYCIEWVVAFTGTVTDDRFFLLLRAGATVADTQLKFTSVEINNQFDAIVKTYWTAGASGSQTFTATARRSAGTGTLTAAGSAINPRHLTVERMN
jgi:hypothetical protein